MSGSRRRRTFVSGVASLAPVSTKRRHKGRRWRFASGKEHIDASVKAVLDRYGRLLAIGPETGRLVNIVVKDLRSPQILEIGTSYAYSTVWLAEAARAKGGRVTTIELQGYKPDYTREMFRAAGLADYVDFWVGDALTIIPGLSFAIDCCFARFKEEVVPALP